MARISNSDATLSLSQSSRPSTLQPTRNVQVFTLETFSSKDFIVKDFVESLSESAIPNRKSLSTYAPNSVTQPSQAFDPRPLIRTFEHALGKLKTLSEDLQERENELSGSVRRAEIQHNANIKSREKELDRAIASFKKLERTLDGDDDGSGSAAMRIGERLEELDRQRQKAQDAKFILHCWLEVSERGDLSSLDDVRKMGGGEGKVRCAHIARQLLKISQRLDPSDESQGSTRPSLNGNNDTSEEQDSIAAASRRAKNTNQPREIIEKFLEMLEKDLLKSFDEYYRRQNFAGMREYAIALRDFNEGSSVVSLFVNQHQFFIDRSQLVTDELVIDNDTWGRLADPDTEPPGVEPSLQSLIDEVKVVVQEESFIIKRAFPYYEEVLARFVQRVFQQSIQQRLEMVLNKADSISSLAFLRTLQASKSYLAALVEDLKAHGLTEHPEPASSTTAAILDQQLDELFMPYFTGSSYIEREKRNLGELFEGLLFKFALFHSRRKKLQAQSSTYLASFSARSKEFISSAREAYIDRLDSADLQPGQKAMLLRVAGLNNTKDLTPADIDVTNEDGQLSIAFTRRMLKWLAEGVGRGLELAGGGNDTPKEIRELLHLLVSNLGEVYLETALDATIDAATAAEASGKTKADLDLSYVRDLKTAINVLHLMLTTIQMLLLPLAAGNLTISRDLEKQTSTFVEHMEAKVDVILQKTIDAALAWTTRALAGQKKTDFRPRDDTTLQLDQLQTATCQTVFVFYSRLRADAATALSGRVLESFSLELATGLRALLLQHFKSFQVSLTGALAVSKDIFKYIELLRSWKLPASFDPSLDVLGEIANLFVIGPEALRDRLRNFGSGAGSLQGVEKADLRPYILRREDSGSVGVQAALHAL
jgi:hypothetical protein